MSSDSDSYDYYSSIDTNLPDELDPSTILLNYTSPYGDTELTFNDLDVFKNSIVKLSTIFGVRIGLAAIAIPVTYFITKKKRPVFFLNIISLFVLLLHSILFICTLANTYNSVTYHFSGYLYIDQNASRLSAATNSLYVLLIALVEASLTFQVFGIFRAIKSGGIILGYIATAFAGTLGLLTTSFYFAYCSMSNKAFFDNSYSVPTWIVNAPIICFATSSCLIMLMLLSKLAVDIRQRRKMGVKQFNFQHIVFIMSFQTMFIPTVIILLSFYGIGTQSHFFQSLSALGTALIAISLPVTTMWATSANNSAIPTSTAGSYVTKIFSNYSGYTDRTAYHDYDDDDDNEGRFGKATTPTSEKTMSNVADFKFKKYDNMDSLTNDSITPTTAVTGDSPFNWDEVEYLSKGVAPNDLTRSNDVSNEEFITSTVQTSIINKN